MKTTRNTLMATIAAAGVLFALCAAPAGAGVVTTVGTGSGSLVHNGTTKIDIMDPNDDNIVNTAEWGFAPTIVGPPNGAGFYNASGGWASIFDNSTGSKVCCNFNPGVTSFRVDSATSAYTLSGYTIATGNDDYGRRPTGWRLYGSDDGFVASNVLLDTVTPADPNTPNNDLPWTAGSGGNQQVGEVTALDNPGGSYRSFRVVFDENSTSGVSGNNGAFQMSEVELIGTLAPLEAGGNDKIGTFQPPLAEANTVGGARFVRVSEESVVDGNLHISEIEVFNAGVTPDQLGPGSANSNPALSTNDYSTGLSHHVATTTSSIQHGLATRVYDGDHEGGGDVWSTNNVSSPDPRFTLDLGGARGVGTVRVYPRNDNCCSNRFEDLRFDVFADDGTGNPGALLGTFTDNVPDGASLVMREATFNIPLISADIKGTLESDHTYVFELDALTGTMDMIGITNPNPAVYGQTILDLNNATAVVELINGVPAPGTYHMLSADSILGDFDSITLPTLPNGLEFDTSGLGAGGDGALTIVSPISAIPEPMTMLAVSLSIAGLGGYVKRRRKLA